MFITKSGCLKKYLQAAYHLLDKSGFENHDFISGYYSTQGVNKSLPNAPKQRIYRSLLTLSIYTISHKFTLAHAPHKGKNKGRKMQ